VVYKNICGKVAGMDCFSRPEALERTFMQMIEDYAKTAVEKFDPKMNLKSSRPAAINLLQTARESRIEPQSAAGLGTGACFHELINCILLIGCDLQNDVGDAGIV